MYYYIFEAIAESGKGEIAEAYYKALVPKVRGISGFVKDTFFVSPHLDGKAVNIAEWQDADAVSRWRNESTHLRAQEKGRDVYQNYRLQLGPDVEAAGQSAGGSSRHVVVLYYRKSFGGVPEDDITSHIKTDVRSSATRDIVSSAVYQGPKTVWVAVLRNKVAAEMLKSALLREQDDALVQIVVERDYTKSDRKDAPSDTPRGKCKL